MPLYKREKSPIWWVDITTPSGERIRCSAKTKIKKQAQEYHDKLKAQLWDQEVLNKEQERYFDEALLLFLRDSEQQKRLIIPQLFTTFEITVVDNFVILSKDCIKPISKNKFKEAIKKAAKKKKMNPPFKISIIDGKNRTNFYFNNPEEIENEWLNS